MKRLFLISLLWILFSTPLFAFEVLNSNGLGQTYFSIADSKVNVKTSQNLSNFSVTYQISTNSQTKVFNLTPCSNIYCGSFVLEDLIFFGNGSFSSSTKFNILIGSESKNVYLDVEKPQIEIQNITIDKKNKKLKIKYNYTDNSNSFKLFDLYEKEGSDLKFVQSLLDKNEIELEITNYGNNIFVFKAIDEASNLQEIEEVIYIGDIFEPIIEGITIIKEFSTTKLEFTITDDNLSKYEISQAGVTISEDISGDSFTKKINIPFTSGKISFKIIDKSNNSITKTLSLDSIFVNNYQSKFSNDKEFEFRSNANKCYLTKQDTVPKNYEFSKSSDSFSIELDITDSREYKLEFYCQKDNFIEYFSRNFYFDNNYPENTQLTVKKNEKGYLDIEWIDSEDDESSITYRLYRNGKEIYQGSKNEYTDADVLYPEKYTYYVEIFDEAKNTVKSPTISEVPKKLSINLQTNIIDKSTFEDPNYDLKISTDLKSDVSVVVKNNNVITQKKDFTNIQTENLNLPINLKKGTNQIIIKIEDLEGNIKEETFYLNYVEPVLAKEQNTQPPVQEKNQTTQKESVEKEPIIEKEELTWWIWFLLGAVFVGILILVIMINHNKIKHHISKIKPKSRNKKKIEPHKYTHSRKTDSILHKSLNSVQKQREERQKEFEREQKKQKQKKELSEFEKQKLRDLQNEKRDFIMPLKSREDSKKKFERVKDEEEYDEVKTPHDKKTWNFRTFFSKNKKTNEHDPFSEYILKKRNEQSWGSTKEYLMRTKLEKEEQEKQKQMMKLAEENKQVSEKMQKEQEKQEAQEKEIKEKEEQEKQKQEKQIAKQSLDEYLTKRRKKSKIFMLAEHFVEKDIMRRKNKK